MAELESEASVVNPKLLAAARARLAESEAQLRQLDEKFSSLKSALVANNCLVMQPAEILQIQFDNPTEVRNVDALFAQTVALGQPDPSDILGGTFPSRDAQQEWKQVLPADLTNTAAHEEDQEGSNLVGASGWALDPQLLAAKRAAMCPSRIPLVSTGSSCSRWTGPPGNPTSTPSC